MKIFRGLYSILCYLYFCMKFKTLPHKIHKIHGRKFSTILNLMTSILFKIPNTEVFQNTLCYVGVSFLCKYAKHMFRLPSGNWTLAQSILFSLLLLEHSRIQMKNLKPVASPHKHFDTIKPVASPHKHFDTVIRERKTGRERTERTKGKKAFS